MNSDKELIRKKALKAARECFADLGVDGCKLQSIADRAGVTKNTLVGVFKTKSLLILELQSADLKVLQAEYLRRMPDTSLKDTIKFIIRSRCEFIEKHYKQTMLIFRKGILGKKPWTTALDGMIWNLSIEFASLAEKALRNGRLKPGTDVNAAVQTIMSVYLTGLVTFGLREERFEADRVWAFIEHQLDFVLGSMES